ncbi:MAG: hypothetical protein H0U42_00705 [Thermoleophilaceae bacterium]|nr:hypothetical protein [Thermoleophilaceae bacterium]
MKPNWTRIALLGGAALLALTLFLPWFSASRGGEPFTGGGTGITWGPPILVALLIGLLLANILVALLVALFRTKPVAEGQARTPLNTVALGVAVATIVFVGFRIGVPPGYQIGLATAEVSAAIGPWLAALACLSVLRGQWLAAGLADG